MKRLALTIALISSLLGVRADAGSLTLLGAGYPPVSGGGGGGITLVSGQTTTGASGFSSTTLTLTLPVNPGSNHLVVVAFTNPAGGTITVADSNSNSYTPTTSSPFTASSAQLGIYFLVAPASATNSITITRSGTPSGAMNAWAAEFSGTATATPLENDATASFAGAGTTINTPSITTTNAGDLLIGLTAAYSAPTAAGTPWTAIQTAQVNNWSEFYVQPSAGAQAINFTQTSSSNWDGMVAAFKKL